VLSVEKEFKKKVVDYFLQEYKKGNTPNPCVVCNKEIKFGFLIKKALSLGADFVATGHYARISLFRSATNFFPSAGKPPLPLRASGPGTAKSSLPRFFIGKDKEKDQSYFLWQLNQKQLGRVLFPVGGFTKPEVRKLAKKFKLPTADTPESQEVCFVSQTTNDFLKKYLKTKPGPIVEILQPANSRYSRVARIVGQHNGLWFYTIGQRRGLEIQQGPWFVVAKDFKKNTLVVSKNEKDLEKKELIADNINWILPVKLPINAEVKIRYKSGLFHALIRANKPGSVRVVFTKGPKGYPRAITPGQSAVFYKKDELIGGGIIN